jgi:phosphohistidine phosphatase
LLLLRHAKSSWKDERLADHDRPLKKRGRYAARLMGELIAAQGLTPDLILASSAVRVKETVSELTPASGFAGTLKVEPDLYLAEPESYLQCLRLLGEGPDRVMCVGHNPGLEDLLERLTGQSERLPTAALAFVRLAIESWSELGAESPAELVGVWRVKELEHPAL